MIHIIGPAGWPTVLALQTALRNSPVDGSYRLGGAALDSITQLTRFREAGLATPDFTTSLPTAMEWVVLMGDTVFGRMLHHTRANDICLPGRRNLHGDFSRRWRNSQW